MASPTSETPAVMPRQTMWGHTSRVRGVVHLPGGRRIITGSWDGSLRLWDLESSAQIGENWRDDGDEAVRTKASSPNGKIVASGSAHIGDDWRDDDDEEEEEEEIGVNTIALSPIGKTVASGSYDGTVRLWDVETGKVITKWRGCTEKVWSVCWSADGERVLSGSGDGTARVWVVNSGMTVLEIKTRHKYMWAVIYSPDSTKCATGGYDKFAVEIWDAKTGELLTTLKHDDIVCSLAWTSDGKKLICGSFGSIRIFNTTTWREIAILDGHTSIVNAISLSPNDRLLASASYDSTARLWNLDTNLPIGPPLQHEPGDSTSVQCATFSNDVNVLVTGGLDNNAYVWDIHAILKEAGLEDLLLPITDVVDLRDTDATQAEYNQLPPDFFDGGRHGVYSSTTYNNHYRSSTRSHPPAHSSGKRLLGRLLTPFHRSPSNINEATRLQQRPRRSIFSHRDPRVVEIAAVRDKQALYVAPQPVKKTQGQSQGQAQSSSSPSQPAAASTSMAHPDLAPDTNTATPGAATVRTNILQFLARLVLFLCCAYPPHADGH